ncbi:hypothetical protein PMAYCL1PPCAC_21685, partial [Pristionchus mayeri]
LDLEGGGLALLDAGRNESLDDLGRGLVAFVLCRFLLLLLRQLHRERCRGIRGAIVVGDGDLKFSGVDVVGVGNLQLTKKQTANLGLGALHLLAVLVPL